MDTEVRKIAYNLYQLDWLACHGYGLDDVIEKLESIAEEHESDGERFSIKSVYFDWLFEIGFNGEIFVSYDEFLDNEYQDNDYMAELFSNRPDKDQLLKLYFDDKS